MSDSFILNGKEITYSTASTIGQLLCEKEINPSHVVIEVNRAILDRDLFDTTPIQTGDVIEVLRFVGGG